MSRSYSDLKEYLNDKHYDDCFNAISTCLNKGRVDLSSRYIEHPFEHEIENVFITSLYTQRPNQNDYCEVIINAIAYAEISITGYVYIDHHKEEDQDGIRRYFSLIIKANIRSELDIKSTTACPIEERDAFKLNESGTKSFIPYISEDNIENVDTRFLSKFYPEALESPMKLDEIKLAATLGLNIIHTELPEGVFGQMLFSDKKDLAIGNRELEESSIAI